MIIPVIILSTLFLIILSYSIYSFLNLYRKKTEQYLNDLERITHVYQTNLLTAQIEIQEQTFQNLSREIHDNIGQKLSVAKMHLNILYEDEEGTRREKIGNSLKMIGQAINDLSDISRSLSSDRILDNGLIKALEFEIQQLKKSNKYTIDFKIDGEPVFLDNKKELILFRIIQEGINNIIKHSESNCIDIQLDYQKEKLILSILDNGKGFQHEKLNNHEGTGLNNMIKRTKMIGGEFCNSSKPNEGTKLTVKVPYNYEIGKNESHFSR